MSPNERIDKWKLSQASESVAGNKRKRLITPSTSTSRRQRRKMDDDGMDYTPDNDYEGDILMDDGEEDELASAISDIRVAQSPSYHSDRADDEQDEVEEEVDVEDDEDQDEDQDEEDGAEEEEEEEEVETGWEEEENVDNTNVVSEEEYHRTTPSRRRIIDMPTEQSRKGVSAPELRAAGWDDDHIPLVQKIVMRGFEPLLPRYWKWDYRFLPDALFSADDEAFISSATGKHFHGIRALEKLFELGGRTRDRMILKNALGPEQQVRRSLLAYMKWADRDAQLDKKTAIPLIALVMKPAGTPAPVLQESARRKLAKLEARYEEAFRIKQSIELPPSTNTSNGTKLVYQVPQLYAIIASHTVVALVAYRPDDTEHSVKSMAFFDLKDKDYDVWNALALASVVCHARNVQMRVAEETGLGVKEVGVEEVEDDPDA